MDEDRYKVLKSLLLTKKNVILQGAPGVGKTFAAKRLALSLIHIYSVRGCTALLDAIGGAIRHIGNVHKYARNEDVPEHTLFLSLIHI